MKFHRIAILITVIAMILVFTDGVLAGWSTVIIDDGGDDKAGQYTSQEIINGQPAISYLDASNWNLKYVRANDAANQDWGSPTLIDTTNVRAESDLLLVDGYPAIAYFDSTLDHLKFVRATDANGTSWGTKITVDDSGVADWYLSAAIVDGFPAICYYNVSDDNLMYVRATDAQGANWGDPLVIDSITYAGYECSLAVVDGFPAIGYLDYSGDGLVKYVRATNAQGSSWDTPITIISGEEPGYLSELVVVNGHPALAYHDFKSDSLKFVRSTNSQGNAWGTPEIIDSSGVDVGLFTSLNIVNGFPAISYVVNKRGNPELRYVSASTKSGSTWNDPDLVATDHTGWWNSLINFLDQPAISFYDTPKTALRFSLFDPTTDNTIYLPIVHKE